MIANYELGILKEQAGRKVIAREIVVPEHKNKEGKSHLIPSPL